MKITSPTKKILCSAICAAGLSAGAVAADDGLSWTNLVSDINGVARHTDATNLKNPWGLVPGLEGFTNWVADNGAGVVTRYRLNGAPFTPAGSTSPEVITVPPISGGVATTGTPTGLILDYWSYDAQDHPNEFLIKDSGGNPHPSHLLACSEDGAIYGINAERISGVAVQGYPSAAVQGKAGDSYTGLALAAVDVNPQGANPAVQLKHRLFAANWGTGAVDVFESDFTRATTGLAANPFTDPNAVTGYFPFNITRYSSYDPTISNYRRVLLVSYAQKSTTTPFGGYIDVFGVDGSFRGRLVDYQATPTAAVPSLSRPWGMAIYRVAPLRQLDYLIVGNNATGTIDVVSLAGIFASSAVTPRPLYPYTRDNGKPFVFDNLWSLHFGRPGWGETTQVQTYIGKVEDDELFESDGNLYLSAGIGSEEHGLVSRIVGDRESIRDLTAGD